jgi:thioredoxin 1
MNEVKGQFSNVIFEDIDVDENFELASKYGVRSVPTVVLEKDGVEINRFVGVQSKLAYTNAINENL